MRSITKAGLISSVLFINTFYTHTSLANDLNECGNNKQAQLLVELIKTDVNQKRADIRCNKVLTLAAQAKAIKMADFGLVAHNLGGSPNSRLIEAGYKLPEHYGKQFNSNQVEAIAGGYSNAHEVWDGFKRSIGHRTHLLGEHEFYVKQDEIGVAFIKDDTTTHVEYWVVYLTKGYEKNQSSTIETIDIPNKSLYIIQSEKLGKKEQP